LVARPNRIHRHAASATHLHLGVEGGAYFGAQAGDVRAKRERLAGPGKLVIELVDRQAE
jgi:hypothetical protein